MYVANRRSSHFSPYVQNNVNETKCAREETRLINPHSDVLDFMADMEVRADFEAGAHFNPTSRVGNWLINAAAVALLPATMALKFVQKHPFASAAMVLATQFIGLGTAAASAKLEVDRANNTLQANQTSLALSPHARFQEVKEACDKADAGIECFEHIVRLCRSDNKAQSNQTVTYLEEHQVKLVGINEKQVMALTGLQDDIAPYKPKPERPKPTICESASLSAGLYKKLTDCVTHILDREPDTADNKCKFVNHCDETVKLTFGNETVTLRHGATAPCFKAGVYHEDVMYVDSANSSNRVARATVKTAYSVLHCDLEGNYSSDDTIVSKVESASSSTLSTQAPTESPIVTQLKQECETLSPIACAEKVVETLKLNGGDPQLEAYIKENYTQLLTSITAEINRLEIQKSLLEEDYLGVNFEAVTNHCEQMGGKVIFVPSCADGLARLIRSHRPETVEKTKHYVAQHKNLVAGATDKGLARLYEVRKNLQRCEPGRADPNACESTQYKYKRYEPLSSCVRADFPRNAKSNAPECQYVNRCDDPIRISYGNESVTLHKNDKQPCFVSGTIKDSSGATRKVYAGATCNLNGNYESNEAKISRLSSETTSVKSDANALKELQDSCDETSTIDCAEEASDVFVKSGFDQGICSFITEHHHDLDKSVEKHLTRLIRFKELYLESPNPLDKCRSSDFSTPLQDCITLIFDCDSTGDNTCEYLNQCPEDLVLTRNWQSKRISSAQKIPCFEDGVYTDLNGRGELQDYKRFAAVHCGGDEDSLENYGKVFVSKVNG